MTMICNPQQPVPVAVSTSLTGSPTATSPRLTNLDLLLAQTRGEVQVSRKMLHKSRLMPASELQLAMF